MMSNPIIDIIIPAFNEENSVGNVINDLPKNLVREIIVVNNNSTDATAINAKNAGATVIEEATMGYGNACLKGISHLNKNEIKPNIVVFLDADYSDYPEEIIDLITPITTQNMDMVIGSRALGNLEKGAMTPQQVFGNWLATFLLKLFYRFQQLAEDR